MATAFVSSSGTAAYPGTASLPTSISLALSSAGAGDIINIAPGNYTVNNVTYSGASGTAGNAVQFIGNPSGSLFTGIPAGRISFTGTANLSTGTGTQILTITSKNYVQFSNITFDRMNAVGTNISLTTCDNLQFSNCVFYGGFSVSGTAAVPINHVWQNCIFLGGAGERALNFGLPNNATTYNNAFIVRNCLFLGFITGGFTRGWIVDQVGGSGVSPGGGLITNCTFYGHDLAIGVRTGGWNTSNPLVVQNCLFASTTALSGSTGQIVNTNCRFTFSGLIGITSGTGSTSGGILGADMFESLLYGISTLQPFSSILSSPNASFGTATNAPAADLYGVTWTGTSPDAGSATFRNISSVGSYLPTERNASTITIAPGSNSQSIELYLGATGLTASTAGLSARYNRTRTASVSIPLVARTIAQAWTSGGFAEVDATNMPGVYRLDVPDAALAAGADDVTIVVRGASGTNGAVMTVKLSSGGLTEAQTAAAVLDAVGTSYATAGSIGYAIQNSNVASISGSTSAADELEGALLHNGTDYISADLLTPVSAATSVHIGPYQLLADGLGADQPLDVNVGTATSIDVQVTDANGTGIDITGATVSAKVYNSGGTLVATYAGTATYADNGRLTFGLTTTVTATSGTYTVTVTRTTGATDTQIFGPLRLYVRPV